METWICCKFMWDTTSIKIKCKLPKNYVVFVCDEKVSRHFWRIAIVTGVLPSRDSETKRSGSENYKDQCNLQTSSKSTLSNWIYIFFLFGFSFTHIHDSQINRRMGKGVYLIPLYHFHPLHRHLDISRMIVAGSSPLHIASSRTRTGNLWFPSASR